MTKPRDDVIAGDVGTGKVALIAGSGLLPVYVAQAIAASGREVFVVRVDGEADTDDFSAYAGETLALEDAAHLVPLLRRVGAKTAVMAGGISRRPDWRRMRPSVRLLTFAGRMWKALMSGDNGALSVVVGHIEQAGIQVVGAHALVPDLLARRGQIAGAKPSLSDWKDIASGFRAAKALGALDIGQATVAIGTRVAAVEGVEGTDALLERVASYRHGGRLDGLRGGVLVKCAKPGQEMRADLPSIGPATVDGAHRAGLRGIAVEAECALVLQQSAVVQRAEALGLFVVGVSEADLS